MIIELSDARWPELTGLRGLQIRYTVISLGLKLTTGPRAGRIYVKGRKPSDITLLALHLPDVNIKEFKQDE